ncbi:tyrosine-type recombinase/integrase [Leyella lascolaii]|uniref:tyrosine-type recombinase/integrase n=1 Tax=Leyella lascolaii TaxID=1776379 RepID=UPI00083A823F|nr:tyrosine-type recombinase/integrase [Leyella lascolaii]
MVTETAQYSALHCFFDFKQNDEYLLISNTLQFICSILLALAFYFILHVARHTFATLLVQDGTDIYKISKFLGHKSINMTQRYLKYDLSIAINTAKEIKTFD